MLAAYLTGTALPAQATWIVDRWNRPGAHFTDLPTAVAAATDGDTLMLRATSPLSSTVSLADWYESPGLLDGRSLRIVGEAQSNPVIVYGTWGVRNLPSGSDFVIRDVTLVGVWNVNVFGLIIGPNDGRVAFERVTVLPWAHGVSPFGVPATRLVDCSLVTFSRCALDVADSAWAIDRSTVMMDDTTVEQSQPTLFQGLSLLGALRVTDSDLRVAGGRLEGPSPYLSTYGHLASAPLWLCRSVVHLSAGARVIGGTTWDGFQYPGVQSLCSNDPAWPDVHYDSSVQIVGPQIGRVNYLPGPQAGVRLTRTATTLSVRQEFGQPPSASLLLIGALHTPSWSAGIGPVFLDAVTAWSDLRLAPVPTVHLQTFPIPPAVPPGIEIGVQAFAWSASTGFLTSNAAVMTF